MSRKDLAVTVLCVVVAIICGVVSDDLLIGGAILATGLLCAYFASEGKRVNYVMGLVNYALMGYVSLQNNLFGLFFFYIFIFTPLQIWGIVSWRKHLDANKSVKARHFELKNSIIIVTLCVVGSLVLGYFLTLIPGQQVPFLDSISNCINLCGVVLMVMRFEESWWLWLVNNVVDLVIWIIMVTHDGQGATMMLLASIGYLLINLWGIYKWGRQRKQVA